MNQKEIISKIKQSISIPNKPSSKIIIGTVGLVGSGKTTVIKPIAEELGLVRISSDEIRFIMKDNDLSYEFLKNIFFELISFYHEQGYGIALDADCGNPVTKEFVEEFSVKNVIPVFWLHVNPPEDFIIKKLMRYDHTWLFKNGDQAVENYFAQKEKRLEQNALEQFHNFAYVFDTSQEVEQQIIEAVAVLKKKSHPLN